MYSKQEAAQLKEAFWTTFGKYMSPVLSADGEKVNWINYKTGEKNVQFRMQADNKQASIAIELSHKDSGIRDLYFAQLEQLKPILESETGEPWQWQPNDSHGNGRTVSRVICTLSQVSIFKKEDWPQLISFFKPRIIALDAFWSQVKYAFEMLRT
jgi:hypothetical protein